MDGVLKRMRGLFPGRPRRLELRDARRRAVGERERALQLVPQARKPLHPSADSGQPLLNPIQVHAPGQRFAKLTRHRWVYQFMHWAHVGRARQPLHEVALLGL